MPHPRKAGQEVRGARSGTVPPPEPDGLHVAWDVSTVAFADPRYRATLDAVPDGVILYELDAVGWPVPVLANPAALTILAMSFEELQASTAGTHSVELLDVDGEVLRLAETPVARLIRERRPFDDVVWGYRRPGGERVWVRSSGRLLQDPHGRLTGLVMTLVDVTTERRAHDALEAAHARYEALIEDSTDVIVIIAADGTVLYASPSYEKVLGARATSAVGRSVFDRLHPTDSLRVQIELIDLARRADAVAEFACRARAADGSYRHLQVRCRNRLDDPAIAGVVVNCRDVTERVEAAAELAHHATHDQLTGLANRLLMVDRLGAAMARAKRAGRPMALLFLDLDNFKRVNDTLGHPTGDRLLTVVAERLSAALRPGDSVARFGGDEFVVLAEDVPSRTDAVAMADRLRATIGEPVELDGRRVAVDCSVGISVSADNDPDTMLQEADIALFRAKAQGRGRSQLYSTMMRALARTQLDSEDLLRRALDDDRVVTLFQPIIDLETGRAVSAEALVRICGEDGSLVPPDRFISVAEDNGLIVPLGEVVLDQACAQLARWRADGLGLGKVTYNLSARQLATGGLADSIGRTLARHGLQGGDVGLEITESSLMDAGSSALPQIEQLKAWGASILLDDFGTGWSSLAYLRQLPVDGLKVDRSFVSGLGESSSDTELVRAVVGLGHALSLDVVAEGVETDLHVAELRRLGCRFGQGYLFARPSAGADLARLLRPADVA
jgi:diguanylate cyclase (GGDEF)-like protein/PAS domain S-box-containing protein